jgi:DNA-binding transcriptional LysR family regulator
MYSNLIEACENAGFTPRIASEVERMLTNISLVAAGAGISVVPASMKDFHRDSVVYCRIRNAKPRLVAPITLVSREDSVSPTETNFLELAKTFARQHKA